MNCTISKNSEFGKHVLPTLIVRQIISNSSMHCHECVVLCKDISLQRGWFCTRSLASCIPGYSEGRPSWMFFIQVVRGCPGTTRTCTHLTVPERILLKQETVSGSGISWAICKSVPRCRQITTPAPHHSVFTGRMPFLSPNQQRQSTEGTKFRLWLCKFSWICITDV